MAKKRLKTFKRSLGLRIWGLLAFIILLVIGASTYIFYSEVEDIIKAERNKSEKNFLLFEQFAQDEVERLLQDLEFFSRNPAYAEYLTSTKIENDFVVKRTLFVYGEIRENFIAIQLIDTLGYEKLHLNFYKTDNPLNPPLVKTDWLKKIGSLSKDELYFGTMQLYQENEETHFPPKPTISLGIPIYKNNKKLGYLLVHYKAQRLLNRLATLQQNTPTKFLLVSKAGLWLKGPSEYHNFSHAITPKAYNTAFSMYPKLEEKLTNNAEGFYRGDKHLVGFKECSLHQYGYANYTKIKGTDTYYLLSSLPANKFLLEAKKLLLLLLLYAFLLIAILTPAFILIFRFIVKIEKKLSKKKDDLLNQNEALNKSKAELELSLAQLELTTSQREIYLNELKKHKEDLSIAQKIAQLAYYKHDVTTKITVWSENVGSVIHTNLLDSIKEPEGYLSLIHPSDLAKFDRTWNEAIREGKSFEMIYRVNTGNDKAVYLQDNAEPVFVNRKVKFMQGTVQNVTERVLQHNALVEAKEKAEEAKRAKSDFLATMSHEIRTPLNAVLGMSNLLKTTPLTARQKDFLRTIEASGDSLLSVINNILDYSKIESGRMVFERKWFSVTKLVEESLQVIALAAERKNLRIFYYVEEKIPQKIKGDENRLRQALINFLNNAVKFTNHGEIWIDVAVLATENDEYTLKFSVFDTGIGIPKNKQQSVFNAFEQADNSISRIYGGSGLGLSITKELITAMDGNLGLNSVENEGSEFYFTLPFKGKNSTKQVTSTPSITLIGEPSKELDAIFSLCKYASIPYQFIRFSPNQPPTNIENRIVLFLSTVEIRKTVFEYAQNICKSHQVHVLSNIKRKSNQLKHVDVVNRPLRLDWLKALHIKQKEEAPALAEDTSLNKDLKILVAEDNPVNQKLIRLVFEQFGLEADFAKNGFEAVQLAEDKRYDIIFMDIQMPEMDGMEATKAIRNSVVIENQPTIIALTANALEGQKEVYLQAGMDHYISKPMNFEALKKLLIQYGTKP